MIHLTRLDDSSFVLAANRIETVEARPDTVITLVDGKHLIVRQSVEEVVKRVIQYQRLIHHVSVGSRLVVNHGDLADG